MYLDVSHTHAVGDPQASACAKCAELFTVVPEVETSNQKRKSLMCFGSGLTQLFWGLFDY